jgi:hypothetical protein
MKKRILWSVLTGATTSVGLFLVVMGLHWLAPASVSLTVAFCWIAPALLLQGRAPIEAAYDAGVGPPDVTTWFLCFLFWALVGGFIYFCIPRRANKALQARASAPGS